MTDPSWSSDDESSSSAGPTCLQCSDGVLVERSTWEYLQNLDPGQSAEPCWSCQGRLDDDYAGGVTEFWACDNCQNVLHRRCLP